MMIEKFSCREATRLASDSLDRRLNWSERFRLHAHLMMCALCRRCIKQFKLIHHAAKSMQHVHGLSASEKEMLRQRLHQALQSPHSGADKPD